MSDVETMSQQVWEAATGVSTLEECAAFEGPLVVKGAEHLRGLEHFTSLRGLVVLGGDVTDLGPVATLPSLRALKIVGAKVSDLSPLAGLNELESLEVNFTFVEDLSPIEGLRNLGWLALFGNPLDDASYHQLLERKRTTAVERWRRPCIVEVSDEDEWKACRTLFETGAKVCWGSIPRGSYTLVRPGRGVGRLIEFLQLPATGITKILAASDPTQAPAVVNMFAQPGIEQSPARFGVTWQAGLHVDASNWLQAARWLPDDEKARYLRFVDRFDGETFYREHDDHVRFEVVRNNTRFPTWFVRLRLEALASVRPHESVVDVRFESFDSPAPTRSGGWYQLGWISYNDSDLRQLLHDKLGLFPIAEIAEPSDLGHSVLAINLRDPEDRAIYEVDPMYAAAGDVAVTPVFASYGALLDRIAALRTGDVVTEATN